LFDHSIALTGCDLAQFERYSQRLGFIPLLPSHCDLVQFERYS